MKKFFARILNYIKNNSFYSFIALAGYVFRVVALPYLIPNIFEAIAEFFIVKLGLPYWAYWILIRVALAFVDFLSLNLIFYVLTFRTVGCFYEVKSLPWWGSLCYTVFYIVYMAIPILLFNYFIWWVIAVVFASYAIVCFTIYFLSYRLKTLPDNWIFRLIVHVLIFVLTVVVVCIFKAL